jgi:hypothetical protein
MKSLDITEKVKRKLSHFKIISKGELIKEDSDQESGELNIDLRIKMDLTESFDQMVKEVTNEGKRMDKEDKEIEEEILSKFEDGDYADFIKKEEIEDKVYREFKYSEEVDLAIKDIYLSLDVGATTVKNVAEARKKVEGAVIDIQANFSYSLNYELVGKIKKEIEKRVSDSK